ncbi:MAG TPA: hypothetical protein VG797_02560 [Phycisphaerales bacterium]|nr:hypothetical protein [Phycisphaerales bacterium]
MTEKAAGTIRVMCPNLRCRAVLGVPEGARGRLVRCKNCGMNIRIPQKQEAKPADAAAPPADAPAAPPAKK